MAGFLIRQPREEGCSTVRLPKGKMILTMDLFPPPQSQPLVKYSHIGISIVNYVDSDLDSEPKSE